MNEREPVILPLVPRLELRPGPWSPGLVELVRLLRHCRNVELVLDLSPQRNGGRGGREEKKRRLGV